MEIKIDIDIDILERNFTRNLFELSDIWQKKKNPFWQNNQILSKTNKQNKQTKKPKQTNNQKKKQTNKQTNKGTNKLTK